LSSDVMSSLKKESPSIETSGFIPAISRIVGAKSILTIGFAIVEFSLTPGPLEHF